MSHLHEEFRIHYSTVVVLSVESLRVHSWEDHYEYAIFYRPHQNLHTIAHFKGNYTYFNIRVIIYYQKISLITKNIIKS